jgi:transposase-like protein
MGSWSGYWRTVREGERDLRIFVPRARCAVCRTTHALLPAFCFLRRLHSAATITAVVEEVLGGPDGVRPAARRHGVVHETARGWVRRFRSRAGEIAAGFAALSVELGGEVVTPLADACSYGLAAIGSSFEAASALPGWAVLGLSRFVAVVSGGALLSANTTSPYLVIGRRRFMPPVPHRDVENGGEHGP